MSVPTPVPGLVIRYSYLWQAEALRGQQEGVKDRPCAIVLAAIDVVDGIVVTVLPITHQPPADARHAIELPHATKRRLGLDDDQSWVVLTEANRFLWPGPDLRPARPAISPSVAYGQLPFGLLEEIQRGFLAAARARRTALVRRTE